MSGLGIIEVKDRPARMGRNPATGATVQIAASKKVAFHAEKVNGGADVEGSSPRERDNSLPS